MQSQLHNFFSEYINCEFSARNYYILVSENPKVIHWKVFSYKVVFCRVKQKSLKNLWSSSLFTIKLHIWKIIFGTMIIYLEYPYMVVQM